MDDEKENLAGSLSKPKLLPNNSLYIGAQSRFEKREEEKEYDFLAIVSGPEPQRTILEKGLIKALKDREEKSIIVLGKPCFRRRLGLRECLLSKSTLEKLAG